MTVPVSSPTTASDSVRDPPNFESIVRRSPTLTTFASKFTCFVEGFRSFTLEKDTSCDGCIRFTLPSRKTRAQKTSRDDFLSRIYVSPSQRGLEVYEPADATRSIARSRTAHPRSAVRPKETALGPATPGVAPTGGQSASRLGGVSLVGTHGRATAMGRGS